jgi:hypothetical protein
MVEPEVMVEVLLETEITLLTYNQEIVQLLHLPQVAAVVVVVAVGLPIL